MIYYYFGSKGGAAGGAGACLPGHPRHRDGAAPGRPAARAGLARAGGRHGELPAGAP